VYLERSNSYKFISLDPTEGNVMSMTCMFFILFFALHFFFILFFLKQQVHYLFVLWYDFQIFTYTHVCIQL